MDFKNFHNFSLVRKGSRFEVGREKQLIIIFNRKEHKDLRKERKEDRNRIFRSSLDANSPSLNCWGVLHTPREA